MRLLIDTHIALWLAVSPARLSASASSIVRDGAHELVLSTASAWEIAVKHAAGKLLLPAPPEAFVPELCRRLRLAVLVIEISHALRAGTLPMLHRDPFDRVLVAQAQVVGLPIMTVDPKIARYDVEVISG
ncbi:MAG TPA: type II toxin-antitoxin system VapC family toxin [Microlunatus sp.]